MPRLLKGRDVHARSSRMSVETHVEFELQVNQPLRLIRAHGQRIECLSGMVWLTAYQEASDVILHPGDVYVVPNTGLVLMEAVGTGRVRIVAAHTVRRPLYFKLLRISFEHLFGLLRITER